MAQLVSILIPTYNRSSSIKRAILSCLSQTYENIEIIITDNSTDNKTEILIDKLNNRKIKYYKNKKNIGPILNWKKAFDMSIGQWIVLLPDDDYFINPFYINDCIDIVNKHNVNLVVTDCILGYPNNKFLGKSRKKGLEETSIILENLWKNIHIPTIANFFNKKLAENFNFFYSNDILYSDIELWLLILIKEKKIYFYDIPSVYYTFHENNIVTNMSVDLLVKNTTLFDHVFEKDIALKYDYIIRYYMFVINIYPTMQYKLLARLQEKYNFNIRLYLLIYLKILKKNIKVFTKKTIAIIKGLSK